MTVSFENNVQTINSNFYEHQDIIEYFRAIDAYEENGIPVPIEVERAAFITRDIFMFPKEEDLLKHLEQELDKLTYFDSTISQETLDRINECVGTLNLQDFYSHLTSEQLMTIGW
jgi:hypothetical protein